MCKQMCFGEMLINIDDRQINNVTDFFYIQ